MILYPLRKHDSPSKALEFGKMAYWTETSNDTDGWQIHRLAIKNAETQKVQYHQTPDGNPWFHILAAEFYTDGIPYLAGLRKDESSLLAVQSFMEHFEKQLDDPKNRGAREVVEALEREIMLREAGIGDEGPGNLTS
jgi:hypothetical protein